MKIKELIKVLKQAEKTEGNREIRFATKLDKDNAKVFYYGALLAPSIRHNYFMIVDGELGEEIKMGVLCDNQNIR